MMILAIDLGKSKSVFCGYDPAGPSHRFATVDSTPTAFHEVLAAQRPDRVVIEVCDMAGWVQDLCQTLQIPVQVVNANGEGWRWKNVRNKTDREDALKLARLSAAGDVELVHLPDRTTRHWRSLILYRQKLVDRRTAIRNSIHALLVREGRAISGKEAFGLESLAAMRELARPVEACSKDQLWSGHLHMELAAYDHIQQQIATLDEALNKIGDADPRVVRLKTIPGVGPRSSELMVAIIDDPHRFANARQISAYAGLTPRRYQSGQMDRSGRISKAGCRKLRKLLVQVSWGMLRNNPHGREVFLGISKGQKTRRKQAAVALARRTLVWSWAMLRDGTDWQPPARRPTGVT